METPTSKLAPGGASEDVWMLGINLSSRPPWFQLTFCSCGVFVAFMINGLCEEYVFKELAFSYAWYFTFIQSLVYLALAYLHGFRLHQRRQSWRAYWSISLSLVGSMGLTKGSLRYLNYPAQIMFKSSKVIPVMLLGSCFPGLRRTYSMYEYISAGILVVGLVLFILADATITPTFSKEGVIMIVAALVCDAFLGNLQETLFKADPGLTQQEVLFCSTVVGLPFLMPPLIFTGEIFSAWEKGASFPLVYGIIAISAVATYGGQLAILSIISLFGAATTYIVTSLRKALTLALSYIVFTKPFTSGHLFGFLLIAISLGMKTCQLKEGAGGTSYKRVAMDDGKWEREQENVVVQLESPLRKALRRTGSGGDLQSRDDLQLVRRDLPLSSHMRTVSV